MTNPHYSEIVALLRRNEGEERNARDVEDDLKRLLLMSRDHRQRDQMVQAQSVRRIVSIANSSSVVATHRYCAAILGNLAHAERGRLSASSCDRWDCLSHRHNCPLFMLLFNAQCSSDQALQHLSAAALLTFSIQSECQLQIDHISGMPVLLRLLDVRDVDLNIYVACILWNLTKSPLLMLKLETIHGIIKERLARRLTDLLWTPLEPFHLSVRPTGERGITGILDSDGDNLNVMLAASISTELSVVLHIENFTGRPRALLDQYRVKTPLGGRSSGASEGRTVLHFDERGALLSRTCAVCQKAIRVTKKSLRGTFLVCSREGCDQTYHATCSRWKSLDESHHHADIFHCNTCVLHLSVLYYCDFLAENMKNELLLTETRFRSVGIQRVTTSTGPSNSNPLQACPMPPGSAALLDKNNNVIGAGAKKFRVPASSQDLEMVVVEVRYALLDVFPTTSQRFGSMSKTTNPPEDRRGEWSVSYARDGAAQVTVSPGNVVFWPARYLYDLSETKYTQHALATLENAFLYEFYGEFLQDRAYSIGAGLSQQDALPEGDTKLLGLWSILYPRRGICMKLLTEQMGNLKRLADLVGSDPALSTEDSNASVLVDKGRKHKARKKPHFAGKKLNKIAVDGRGGS